MTDEDSADEDGAIDNLSGMQMSAPAHAVLQNNERVGFIDQEPEETSENICYTPPVWNKKY